MAKEGIKTFKQVPGDYWNHRINRITGHTDPTIAVKPPSAKEYSIPQRNNNRFSN